MTALAGEILPAPSPSPFRGLDLCRAAGFEVEPGASGPVFEDDVWDFNVVAGRPNYLHYRALRLEFAAVADPRWRMVAKEYIAALMLPQHERVRLVPGAYRVPRAILTCKIRLKVVARWLGWLADQRIASLEDVTEEMCRRYLAEVSRRVDDEGADIGVNTSVGVVTANVISELAAYRELFSADRYPAGLRPFGGKSGGTVMGVKRAGENKTQPVRDEVLQPALAAALFITETLAPHVLRELRAMRVYQKAGPARPEGQSTKPDMDLLRAVIRAHAEEDRAFVAVSRTGLGQARNNRLSPDDPLAAITLEPIARAAGHRYFRMAWLEHVRDELEATLAKVGVQQPWARCAPGVERADGEGQVPWSVPLTTLELAGFERLLRNACVLVLGASTGMRWSEQMELARGCRLEPVIYGPGLVRYKLASQIVKGRALGGEEDEWVVLKQAHDAVGILEALLGEDVQPGTRLLSGFGPTNAFAAFRAWVNGPSGARLGLAPIPPGPLNPRALRRTLAMELAYRPGGLWAAKLHLKHVSVITTEGYAARPGGAQGRFMAELAEQEQQRNKEILATLYERFSRGAMPSGPGADGLVGFFESIDGKLAEHAGKAPNVALNDRVVAGMMAKKAKTLYLGTANYCWYEDPGKALCRILARRRATAIEIEGPLLNLCDSARCPQATHGIAHREVWARTVKQNTVFIGQISRGQKAERTRLEADLARAQRVLEAIDRSAAALRESENGEEGQ